MRFDKDKWIMVMLRRRYLVPARNGSILRSKSASEDGMRVSAEYLPLKPRIHKATGRVYANITFMGFTKSVLINRVIALAFLPNPNDLPQVNHKDGNKENNAVDNLEWASASDNERHAHRTGLKSGRGSQNSNAKLTAEQVLAIRADGRPVGEVAADFGVARSTIVNIKNGTTWRHV